MKFKIVGILSVFIFTVGCTTVVKQPPNTTNVIVPSGPNTTRDGGYYEDGRYDGPNIDRGDPRANNVPYDGPYEGGPGPNNY